MHKQTNGLLIFGFVFFAIGSIFLGAVSLLIWTPRQSDKSKPDSRKLISAIRYYREMGFFTQFAGQSDEMIRNAILNRYKTGRKINRIPGNQLDRYALCFDEDRARWQPVDRWDEEGNISPTYYTNMLNDCAEISKGIFQPVDISQIPPVDDHVITVVFKLNGEQKSRLICQDGSSDISFIRYLNGLISHSGHRFYNLSPCPRICLVLLTKDEAKKIKQDRGLKRIRS